MKKRRIDVAVTITGHVTVEAKDFLDAYRVVSAFGKTGGREAHEVLDQLSQVSVGMRASEVADQ